MVDVAQTHRMGLGFEADMSSLLGSERRWVTRNFVKKEKQKEDKFIWLIALSKKSS